MMTGLSLSCAPVTFIYCGMHAGELEYKFAISGQWKENNSSELKVVKFNIN